MRARFIVSPKSLHSEEMGFIEDCPKVIERIGGAGRDRTGA